MSARRGKGNWNKRTYMQCYTLISTYIPRRERVRIKYGSHSQQYVEIDTKITSARRRLRKIKQRTLWMTEIEERLNEFIGYEVRKVCKIPNCRDREKLLCRHIFCKYCMENNISGYDVAKFLKCYLRTPFKSRLLFTKSFKTNKENLEMWHRFKLFMRDKEMII